MPGEDLAAWRKRNLAELGTTIGTLRKIKSGVVRACDAVKSTAKKISREAEQRAQECERALGEIGDDADADEYAEYADAKDALDGVLDADEQADDAKLQVGDSLDGLIAHLEEIKEAVKAIDP